MDILVLTVFICVLIGCVITDISILYPLVIGYILFAVYTVKKGYNIKETVIMSAEGIKTAKNILVTFMLIGIITSLWRAGGTIPTIVCYSTKIMHPDMFIIITFLLNCILSVLTGTAFGTAATMGSICMTMATALNIDPVITGGAVLSGVYFGDRCSPVSTSALLVSELTGTNLFSNIKNMLKTSAVPFVITCLIYYLCGVFSKADAKHIVDVNELFSEEFLLSPITVIPAVFIVVLSLLKVNVKITMIVSIAFSALICFFYQKIEIMEILKISLFGYSTQNVEISGMINGGGIVSMLRVAAIVCISSAYSGIFKKTGLLNSIMFLTDKAVNNISVFAVVVITSIASGMIACNQTLSIMLTEQICSHLENDKEQFAVYLENSVVLIAPLVPWSIAGAVPLASSGAPTAAILTSFFLYLLPIYHLIVPLFKRTKAC